MSLSFLFSFCEAKKVVRNKSSLHKINFGVKNHPKPSFSFSKITKKIINKFGFNHSILAAFRSGLINTNHLLFKPNPQSIIQTK